MFVFFFFFSSRRRHTRLQGDWSSDVCSSDLLFLLLGHRAVSQLPKEGKWSSFLRRIIPPAVILIIVLAGHRVIRALAGPFLPEMDRMIYNLIFLLVGISVALWLILAVMRSSAMLTQESAPSRKSSDAADK